MLSLGILLILSWIIWIHEVNQIFYGHLGIPYQVHLILRIHNKWKCECLISFLTLVVEKLLNILRLIKNVGMHCVHWYFIVNLIATFQTWLILLNVVRFQNLIFIKRKGIPHCCILDILWLISILSWSFLCCCLIV